jgi:hypothetical protein
MMLSVTTQRGEEPAVLPADDDWFTGVEPREPGDGPTVGVIRDVVGGLGAPWAAGPGPSGGGEGAVQQPTGPDDGATAAEPGWAEPGQAGPGWTGPGQAGQGQAGPGQDAPGQDAPGQDAPGEAEAAPTGRRARRLAAAAGEPVAAVDDAGRTDGFDPSDTGTWRVRDVVPGADGGRRHTTILRYLLGLLAVDHLRTLTRFAFAVPVLGLVLLLVKPRWIGLAVIVLGVLLVVGRSLAAKLIARRSLARRYRPVEDDLRAATEAGKANLRGELERVGLPTGRWSMPVSVLRLARGTDRSLDRSKLREVEIHRILPEAQLQRALKVLDEAAPTGR